MLPDDEITLAIRTAWTTNPRQVVLALIAAPLVVLDAWLWVVLLGVVFGCQP